MSTAKTIGSYIPTLDAANLAYQFERVRIDHPEAYEDINEVFVEVRKRKAIPDNLEYVDDFYDKNTGTSGTAFKDENGKIIIAYTGTNPEGDFVRDIQTDVVDIGVAQGGHYGPAFDFYEKIAEEHGAENITLTGHSLGGNIAQRVAIEYNVQNTIVYNAAPLYAMAGYVVGTRAYSSVSPINGFIARVSGAVSINDMQNDIRNFTGKVTRITTADDPLNHYSDMANGVYLGEEYILKNSGGHGLDPVVEDPAQVEQVQKILSARHTINIVLQTTKDAMAKVATKKSEFQSNGLSSSEMIYLDSAQATVIASSLSTRSQAGVELIKALETGANQDAEDLYNELDNVPFYFSLTPEEMKDAYADAGVDYNSIVEHISTHCSEKVKTATGIAEEFTTLQASIASGIATKVQEDQELATLFQSIN